jgi:CubicO group peptidase (beta-lactamase class C family)
MGKAFEGLAAELGKPVPEWTGDDVEKAMPRVDANLPVLPNFLVPNAAASLVTTARDYGTFVRWLLGAGPVTGGRAVLDRMMTQQSTINDALGWGSGLGLERTGGVSTSGTGATIRASRTSSWPSRRRGRRW